MCVVSAEEQQAEVLRTVEGGGLGLHRIPAEVVRVVGEIAASAVVTAETVHAAKSAAQSLAEGEFALRKVLQGASIAFDPPCGSGCGSRCGGSRP